MAGVASAAVAAAAATTSTPASGARAASRCRRRTRASRMTTASPRRLSAGAAVAAAGMHANRAAITSTTRSTRRASHARAHHCLLAAGAGDTGGARTPTMWRRALSRCRPTARSITNTFFPAASRERGSRTTTSTTSRTAWIMPNCKYLTLLHFRLKMICVSLPKCYPKYRIYHDGTFP